MIRWYRKLTSLSRSQRAMVLEAVLLMSVAWVGLRVLRFLALRRALDRLAAFTSRPTGTAGPTCLHSVRWAITSAASRLPGATCLVQALAADVMLRRRHLASELRFGVRVLTGGRAPFEAHAWIESDGGAVIGVAEHQSEFLLLQ